MFVQLVSNQFTAIVLDGKACNKNATSVFNPTFLHFLILNIVKQVHSTFMSTTVSCTTATYWVSNLVAISTFTQNK